MAKIPGVTTPAVDAKENGHEPTQVEKQQTPKIPENAEEPQFEMDI